MFEVFKVLGQEHRYHIFAYLAKYGSSCVCDLEALLDMKQANLSKHLKVMRDQKLVMTENVGKNVHYYIDNEFQSAHQELIELIRQDVPFEQVNASCEAGCEK